MRVSGLPAQARVVVIGAGIVGNSMAYHLAQQGWKEIVLIDKGPLPNPGGSTGHASNFIFLTDHSKEMTLFTLDSVRQYKELGVFTQSGGVEVARTGERMDELKRRIDAAAKYVPMENLCLSPQCGFSSTHHGNNLTEQQEVAKLKLCIDVAREVWG